MSWKHPLGAISVLASGGLLLSGCSVVDNLERFREDGQEQAAEEQAAEEVPEPEFPYVKQGRLFLDTGDDVQVEYGIERLESTDEHMVLDSYINILEPLEGEVTNLTSPPRMIDSDSGLVYEQFIDEDNERAYGTYFEEGEDAMPIHEGAPQMTRRYFPPVPENVEVLTFTGQGMGAMTGIPVEHVDEITEQPEPNADEYIDSLTWTTDVPEGTEVYYPHDEPPAGLEVEPVSLEQFVHSDIASTTRAGDRETIALNADVMFEFDESTLTDEAEEVVQQAAESMRENLGSDVDEITIVGHSDGKGADAYNQTLSEERAETVEQILEEELGADYTLLTEGRGSDEPVAEEGGSDDEEARAQNRRVEFSYEVGTGGEEETQDGEESGLDAAQRHVAPPAPYNEDDGEVHESVTQDEVQLDVYPLTRDGAYLIGTVAFSNTTDDPVEPELGGEDAQIPGGPAQFNEGTLGGFVLSEPDGDVIRYVAQLKYGEDEYAGFAEEVHELQPGEDYRTIAIFPAPSEDVEQMTLHAGEFGEIDGVRIR